MKEWLIDKNQIIFQMPFRKSSLFQEFWRLHILLQGTEKTKYDEIIENRYNKLRYLLFYSFAYCKLYYMLNLSYSNWKKRINAK